jgi:hypothetical protein
MLIEGTVIPYLPLSVFLGLSIKLWIIQLHAFASIIIVLLVAGGHLKNKIMAISMIEHRRGWYDIYDAQGKKWKTLSDSIGEVLGWSSLFFIVRRRGWYDLYDELGRKYKTFSDSIGLFVSISGETFIMHRNGWLDTYDRFGKKINTCSAR